MPLRAQETNDPSLSIWPNPTSGDLTLRLSPDKGKVDAVQVLDLWGRVLTTQYPAFGNNGLSLSIADLPPGIYFVRCLRNGVDIGAAKVVKQ